MSKGFKITLAVILTLAFAVYGFVRFFGGVPAKMLAKKLAHVNAAISDYPYPNEVAPDDYITVEKEYLILRIPADMHIKDDSDPDSIRSHIFVSDTDSSISVLVSEPYDYGAPDFETESDRCTPELLDSFTESAGLPQIRDWYSFYQVLYHMNTDDCDIHDIGRASTFYALATVKEALWTGYETWEWHCASGDGFIQVMRTPETDPDAGKYTLNAQLFLTGSGNVSHDVMVSAPDLETCCQIINSIAPNYPLLYK